MKRMNECPYLFWKVTGPPAVVQYSSICDLISFFSVVLFASPLFLELTLFRGRDVVYGRTKKSRVDRTEEKEFVEKKLLARCARPPARPPAQLS